MEYIRQYTTDESMEEICRLLDALENGDTTAEKKLNWLMKRHVAEEWSIREYEQNDNLPLY